MLRVIRQLLTHESRPQTGGALPSSTEVPEATTKFGPTIFAIWAVGKPITRFLAEIHISSSESKPQDIPDYVARHQEQLRALIIHTIRKELNLVNDPDIPPNGIVYTLRTIGDVAAKVYNQQTWAGGPLHLLKKEEKGWVRCNSGLLLKVSLCYLLLM